MEQWESEKTDLTPTEFVHEKLEGHMSTEEVVDGSKVIVIDDEKSKITITKENVLDTFKDMLCVS